MERPVRIIKVPNNQERKRRRFLPYLGIDEECCRVTLIVAVDKELFQGQLIVPTGEDATRPGESQRILVSSVEVIERNPHLGLAWEGVETWLTRPQLPSILLNTPFSHLSRTLDELGVSCQVDKPLQKFVEGKHIRNDSRGILVQPEAIEGKRLGRVHAAFLLERREFSFSATINAVSEAMDKIGGKFRVMHSWPGTIKTAVLAALPHDRLDLKGCGQVNIALLSDGFYYFSVHREGGGVALRTYQEDVRVPGRPSKAYQKLTEALAIIGFDLKDKTALDIGAAPGGWTLALVHAGCSRVIAVDPGSLAPHIAALPQVEYHRERMENVSQKFVGRSIDIVTCDMNISPTDAFEVLRDCNVLPQTPLIFTLKRTLRRERCWLAEVEKVKEGLTEEGWSVKWLKHLDANTMLEATILATKNV